MKTLLTLCALSLAFAAVPAAANDCTTGSAAKSAVAVNEAVVREMIAYSTHQSEDQLNGDDCHTEDAECKDCRPVKRPVDCVDCPERQARRTAV